MEIKEARFRAGMSQLLLALRAGISASKVSLLERSLAVACKSEQERLAAALGVQPDLIDWPTRKTLERIANPQGNQYKRGDVR